MFSKILSALLICLSLITGCTSQPKYLEPLADETNLPSRYLQFTQKMNGSKFIRVEDSYMHYLEIGSADADPYIFVHGTPVNAYVWRKVLSDLPLENKRVILVDLIGHGLSGRPDIDYTFIEQSRYLTSFINQLELDNINFVVHDLGGQAAFGYIQKNAEKVTSIAAFETLFQPFENYDDFGSITGPMFRFMRIPGLSGFMSIHLNQFAPNLLKLGTKTKIDKQDTKTYRHFFKDRRSKEAVLAVPRSTPVDRSPVNQYQFVRSYSDFLANSQIPKLLVIAEPGVVPDIQHEAASRFNNTKVVTISDTGHFVQEDQPNRLANALTIFWEELDKY